MQHKLRLLNYKSTSSCSELGLYRPEVRVLGPGWPNCTPYVALRLLALKSVLGRFCCMRAAHRNFSARRGSVTLFDHVIGLYSLKLWDFKHPFPPGVGGGGVAAGAIQTSI